MLALVGTGRGRDVDRLGRERLELVEAERPVVEGRWQAEAVLDEGLLAGPVAAVHAPELGDRHVALVDDQQCVVGKVVEQARRRLPRQPPRQVAAVVLDAVAVAELRHHLEVVERALLEPLGLDQLAGPAQLLEPQAQVLADLVHGPQHHLPRGHVVGLREDGQARDLAQRLTRQRVEPHQRLDLVVEERDPDRLPLGIGGEHVDDVAAGPVGAVGELDLVAGVLELGEPAEQVALRQAVALRKVQDHAEVGLGVAKAVDGRHGRHDDRVVPLDQRLRRRQPHLLDVGVDRGVLLDVSVRGRDVGFRLVIVVVRHEVLDAVAREELAHLAVELGRQGLVVGEYERRALLGGDDVRHRERLAGPGHAQQDLPGQAGGEAGIQGRDGLRLVTGRGEFRDEFEAIHSRAPVGCRT